MLSYRSGVGHRRPAAAFLLVLPIVLVGQAADTEATLSPSQSSAKACGVQCLYVAARLAGKDVEYGRLAGSIPVTQSGVSMLDLERAAEDLGLEAEGRRFEPDAASALRLKPLTIVLLDESHYVLVRGLRDDGRISMIDPPAKQFSMSAPGFASRWSGLALELRGSRNDTFFSSEESAYAVRVTLGPLSPAEVQKDLYLGRLREGEGVMAAIIVRNEFSRPLRIAEAKSSCGCAVPHVPQDMIAPASEVPVAVDVVPDSPGRFEHFLFVRVGEDKGISAGDRTLAVRIRGEVDGGKLLVSPPALKLSGPLGEPIPPAVLMVRRRPPGPVGLSAATPSEAWLSCEALPAPLEAEGEVLFLAVSVLGRLPPGEHKGSISVEVGPGTPLKAEIPLVVHVEADIRVVPRAVFRSLDAAAETVVRVRLSSRSGTRFSIQAVHSRPEGLALLEVETDGVRSTHILVARIPPRPAAPDPLSPVRGEFVVLTDHSSCGTIIIPFAGVAGETPP